MQIEQTSWVRDDWRNAGWACRWYCERCQRYGPYDVSVRAVEAAAVEHSDRCKAS